MAKMPGFELMQAQQKAFMKAMTGGLSGGSGWTGKEEKEAESPEAQQGEDLDAIKKQLAELQEKLSKLR